MAKHFPSRWQTRSDTGMPQFDLPPAELETHRVTAEEPPGLDQWWSDRLDAARTAATPPALRRYRPDEYGALTAYDLEFSGAGGDRVRGWYLRPPGSGTTPLPTVVTYIGYGGARGLPWEHALLPAVGYAVVVMDNRGQGGRSMVGSTGDRPTGPGGSEYPGVMTRGIADPEHYYVTRLITDAVRAVEVTAGLPGVDPERIAVRGGSQGGGLALAAAALAPDLVRVCQADVPFLCDLARAVTIGSEHPYLEISEFLSRHDDLVPAALRTLTYVDCALLARRITAPTLVSVGLMDTVCPPSTVYAAYHEIAAPKELAVFPFGWHVPPAGHTERQLAHLRRFLGDQGTEPAPEAVLTTP
ncbi:acetylxylan esterase [Actinoalloteichus caeruleus]|uniref:Cephalosporin-C deacetylase n=2 Tax=Pseudonocardiaceae TaxID=2070 RepID=A0ABT1JFN4_ACTCY|nr:cephalosporin-C deacetylase [Actinoalloteichus caeruleus DSM 43889]